MVVLGLVSFPLYLRGAMRCLDPSAAVPERVRTAFDTLSEGVLVLDVEGRIMHANKAFLALGGPQAKAPTGELATELACPGSWPERLRADVEANAGSSVRHIADVTVTMSFGVEQFGPQTARLKHAAARRCLGRISRCRGVRGRSCAAATGRA